MTLPDVDAGGTYGGYPGDYSPVKDPTKEVPAAARNPMAASVVGMTHTTPRALARVAWQGTGTPTLTWHDANWGNTNAVAPTPARIGVGQGTLTWPANVADDIPSGAPGFNAAGHNLNFQIAHGNSEGGATLYHCNAVVTAPNVVTFYIHNGAGSLADPTSVNFGISVR